MRLKTKTSCGFGCTRFCNETDGTILSPWLKAASNDGTLYFFLVRLEVLVLTHPLVSRNLPVQWPIIRVLTVLTRLSPGTREADPEIGPLVPTKKTVL